MTGSVQLGLLPGMETVIPQVELPEPSQETSAQILLEMFEMIQKSTGQDARASWNQLVRFLADCARVHPMLEEDRPVADRLMALALPFFTSLYNGRDAEGCLPWDPLGEVFTQVGAGDEGLGQNLTPRWVVQYINNSVIGGLNQENESERELELRLLSSSGRNFLCALDPCCGTGRFLLDMVERHCHRLKIALFGVEKDLDLYRACLVNMRLWGANALCPYFILRADALICDLGLTSPNWRWANVWDPPDWEKAFRMTMLPEGADTPSQQMPGLTWEEYQKWQAGETEGIDWKAVEERAQSSYLTLATASVYFSPGVIRLGGDDGEEHL